MQIGKYTTETEHGLVTSVKEQPTTIVGEDGVAVLPLTKVRNPVTYVRVRFVTCCQQGGSAGDLSRPGKETDMNVLVIVMITVCSL